MCGRFVQKTDLREAAAVFSAEVVEAILEPNYNITPRQPVAVILEDGVRKIVAMRWGLVPSWSANPENGYKMINARAETILEKPSFRDSFKKRRCLIIADGFYEWKTRRAEKIPQYIFLKNRQPFAMAGIFDSSILENEENVRTCSIITTNANGFMKGIHHRMPVILKHENYQTWLQENTPVDELLKLLVPLDPEYEMESYEVSPKVNTPAFNNPECILPFSEPEDLRLQL